MSSYMQLAAACFLTAFLFHWSPGAVAVDGLGPGEFGSLTLCPPGGKAFRMAWSLACEMRRRRKRSDDSSTLFNGHMPHNHIEDSNSNGIKGKNDTAAVGTREKKGAAPQGYRPATLTEIQKICCDVGCEIRDLLSYCDPFGPWNSR